MVKEFEGQRSGERVVFVFRRHISTSFRGFLWFLVVAGMGVIPVALWGGGALPVMVGGFVLGMMGWLYAYALWYFSVYVVTSERIRQISQKGMFKKTVVDVGISKIQSISYKVPGMGGGIFKYGTILIQTAIGDMTVSMVSKPERVYNRLQNVIAKEVDNRGDK